MTQIDSLNLIFKMRNFFSTQVFLRYSRIIINKWYTYDGYHFTQGGPVNLLTQIYLVVSMMLVTQLTQIEKTYAGGRNRSTAKREGIQHKRIHNGVQSGQLSREEAKALRQNQRDINKDRKAAKRDDGKIDHSEKKDLRQQQNSASKDIYNQKHDDDIRKSKK
jgi:hypothetical protein